MSAGLALALALALAEGEAAPLVDPAGAVDLAAIDGVLLRAGDRAPLGAVAVLIYPAPAGARPGEVRSPEPPLAEPAWVRRVLSDVAGRFAARDLPSGVLAIEVVAAGYRRARWIVDAGAARRRPLRLYLRPESRSPYRTVVRETREVAAPAPRGPVERRLSQAAIRDAPGSQGDPLRALQSLPGVARAPFGIGLLVLRGAGPRLSQVFVGEHPVPQAFHLVGLATVVSGDALADLSYVPSNFAPAYGNASGGLVVLRMRPGDRQRRRGLGFVDIGGLGALAEGPAGRGTFLVAARRAHLDLPLRAVAAANPLAPLVVPTYYDAQVSYDRPLRRGQHLHVGLLGAADRLMMQAPADAQGERAPLLDIRSSFHRLDLAYRARLGPTKVLLTPALRFDTSASESEGTASTGSVAAPPGPRRSLVSTLRAAIEHEVSEGLSFLLGADAELARVVGDARSYVYGAPQLATITQEHAFLGLYGDARIRAGGLSLDLGSRLAAFIIDGQSAFAADPRARADLALGERWRLSGGVGLYTQPIVPRGSVKGLLGADFSLGSGRLILPAQIARGFDPTIVAVEGDLALVQAVHASFSVARDFAGEVTAEVTGFYRTLEDREDLERPSDLPRQVAYGGEVLLRKGLTGRVDGWLAYSLLWAQRVADEEGARTRTPSPFDQRHNLVAVLSLRLPQAWRLSGRFRLTSGLPYTPVVGAIWFDGYYAPLTGEALSGRFPLFHQLDVRVDKRWITRRAIVLAYLDLVNAYNAANTEAYIYNRDFSQRVGGLSLPILPLLGVRVEL